MRIAVLTGVFPGLSSTFIIDQIVGLLHLEHDVDVYALRPPDDEKVHEEVESLGLDRRTTYVSIPLSKVGRASRGMGFIRRHAMTAPGAIFGSLDPIRFGRHAWSLTLLYLVAAFLGRQYDVLLCHFGPSGVAGAHLKRLGLVPNVVTVFHGYDLSRHLRQQGRRVYLRLFRTGDLFLPVSEHWRDALVELGCPEDKTRVHHIGIDVDRFRPDRRSRARSSVTSLLSIGRLVEKKGHADALHAVRLLLDRGHAARYTVAGEGPLGPALMNMCQSLGLGEHVRFVGAVTRKEALELYRQADVFLLPSVTAGDGDQEGIPVSLMEAQAMALPVVSTWHSGIPELVRDDITGFLVQEHDTQGLADRLQRLVSDHDLCRRMGDAGAKVVAEDFELHRQNRRLAAMLEQLVNRDSSTYQKDTGETAPRT